MTKREKDKRGDGSDDAAAVCSEGRSGKGRKPQPQERQERESQEREPQDQEPQKPYWVYVALCADGTYYTGIAADVDARFEQHNSGKGAKYARSRRPVECVYREECACKGDALRREIAIKKLSRIEKEALVRG